MLNNVIERDVDRRMERTRRRPTASGRIPPARAARRAGRRGRRRRGPLGRRRRPRGGASPCSAPLYYVVVYTLLLKPRTALSAVPGGLAGVFPALIGWAATGAGLVGRHPLPLRLIPVWSPPHFWALTLALEDDYRASGIPTPPSRYGEAATRRLIAGFWRRSPRSLAAPLGAGLFGAVVRGRPWPPRRAALGVHGAPAGRPSTAAAWALFKVTGPYLALVLAAAVIDHCSEPAAATLPHGQAAPGSPPAAGQRTVVAHRRALPRSST